MGKEHSATGANQDPGQSVLAEWIRSCHHRDHGPDGGTADLPPHHGQCLGCGPDNPHGHQLRAHRRGNEVVAGHVFDERHVGAPGIAHGGAVATVVDDLFGFLLYVVGELAVTRRLDIEYLAPVLLNRPYTLVAALEHREGRKLHLTARIEDEHGRPAATARALFLTVNLTHFTTSLTATGDPHPAAPTPGTP